MPKWCFSLSSLPLSPEWWLMEQATRLWQVSGQWQAGLTLVDLLHLFKRGCNLCIVLHGINAWSGYSSVDINWLITPVYNTWCHGDIIWLIFFEQICCERVQCPVTPTLYLDKLDHFPVEMAHYCPSNWNTLKFHNRNTEYKGSDFRLQVFFVDVYQTHPLHNATHGFLPSRPGSHGCFVFLSHTLAVWTWYGGRSFLFILDPAADKARSTWTPWWIHPELM